MIVFNSILRRIVKQSKTISISQTDISTHRVHSLFRFDITRIASIQHYFHTREGNFMARLFLVFAFFAMLVGASPVQAQTLTSGTPQTGTLIVSGSHIYTFSGSAGEGIILQGHSTSMTIRLTIHRPGGALWEDNMSRVQLTLPDTGTYTVTVRSSAPSGSGAYTLFYLRGGDSVSGGSLVSGTTKNSSLVSNGLDSYQISGTAGQGIILQAINESTPSYTVSIRVYKPDGSFWSTSGNRFIGTLPDSGTYTVSINYSAGSAWSTPILESAPNRYFSA
jgi:hypothetical protein